MGSITDRCYGLWFCLFCLTAQVRSARCSYRRRIRRFDVVGTLKMDATTSKCRSTVARWSLRVGVGAGLLVLDCWCWRWCRCGADAAAGSAICYNQPPTHLPRRATMLESGGKSTKDGQNHRLAVTVQPSLLHRDGAYWHSTANPHPNRHRETPGHQDIKAPRRRCSPVSLLACLSPRMPCHEMPWLVVLTPPTAVLVVPVGVPGAPLIGHAHIQHTHHPPHNHFSCRPLFARFLVRFVAPQADRPRKSDRRRLRAHVTPPGRRRSLARSLARRTLLRWQSNVLVGGKPSTERPHWAGPRQSGRKDGRSQHSPRVRHN